MFVFGVYNYIFDSDSAHIVETSVYVKMMRSQISKMKTDIGLIKKIVVSQSVEAKMEKM